MNNDKEFTPEVKFQSYNCGWANVTSFTGQRIHEGKKKKKTALKRNPDLDLASTTTSHIGKKIKSAVHQYPVSEEVESNTLEPIKITGKTK